MGYTDAPATKLVATACLICRRPLVDAASVEAGIGPVCREKSGFGADPSRPAQKYQPLGVLDPDRSVQAKLDSGNRRGAANALTNFAARTNDREFAVRAAIQIGRLGYMRLSKAVLEGLADVFIWQKEDVLEIRVPSRYNSRLSWMIEQMGGGFNSRTRTYSVPVKTKRRLWGALKKFYKGSIAIGPKGWFMI